MICPGVMTAGIHHGAVLCSPHTGDSEVSPSAHPFTARGEPQLGDPASLVSRGLKFGLGRALHSGATLGKSQPLCLSPSVCVFLHSTSQVTLQLPFPTQSPVQSPGLQFLAPCTKLGNSRSLFYPAGQKKSSQFSVGIVMMVVIKKTIMMMIMKMMMMMVMVEGGPEEPPS